MAERAAGGPTRIYQLSEYENSFRRPSNGSSKNVLSDVAGQSSSKMAILQEASKRAHLNRRAGWQACSAPATASNATPPRRRDSTPPPGTTTPPRTRTTTPPRAATPRTTPPRTHLRVAPSENDMIKEALFHQLTNLAKDRSPRSSSTATPYDSIYQGSPECSEVSGPSSLRQRTDASAPEASASSSRPRRPSVNSPPTHPSPRGVGSDAVEELVRRWVIWSQEISSAVEKGSSLPPPPVPQPDAPGVTSLLLRVLEASAFAAAALARGSMEAKDLRAELSKQRDKARQDEDCIHELKRQVQDLQALSEAKDAKVAEAERRLKAPCAECGEAQLRLSDVADEVESLRGALQDAEARRRKEVEDSLSLADGAEAKYTQLMAVLRQVLASNGSLEGASAAAAADLVAPSISRGALQAQAPMVPSRTHRGEAEPECSSRMHQGETEPGAASRVDRGETEPTAPSRKHRDTAEVTPPRPSTSASEVLSKAFARQGKELAAHFRLSTPPPVHEAPATESNSWWRAPAELRAVGVEADSDPEDPAELSEPESPEPSPVKAWPSASSSQRSQPRNSSPPENSPVPYDSPAPHNSPPPRESPRARPNLAGASGSSSKGHRRSSEPVVARSVKVSEPRIRSSDPNFADATQRLELEVIELCQALGGTSPRTAQANSTRSDFDDDAESLPSPPPRRAKGSRR